jgi:hypothetical protein
MIETVLDLGPLQSETRQLPRLFEIVLLSGYQLRVDDYGLDE